MKLRKTSLSLTACALMVLSVSIPAAAQSPRYKITDLGVLGAGSTDFSWASAINNKGQVAGYSRTASGSVRAFLRQGGSMFDLGTLPGTDMSRAYAINDRGQVVGASGQDDGGGGMIGTAFLWTPLEPNGTRGTMTPLGSLPGGSMSAARGINASGEIVGWSEDANAEIRAFHWTPSKPNDSKGRMTEIRTLGVGPASDENIAFGINDKGQIAGWADNTAGTPHAFLLTPTRPTSVLYILTDLGTLPGDAFSVALGINIKGQVVGYSENDAGNDRAFLWTPSRQNWTRGGMIALGALNDDTDAVARGINDMGQVVGDSGHVDDNGDFIESAFLWSSGQMTDLGSLGNIVEEARGINASGLVAGASGYFDGNDFYGFAFLWQPTIPNGTSGTMRNIGTFPNEFSAGYDLSAAGVVVRSSSAAPDGPLVSPATDGFLWQSGTMTDLGNIIPVAVNGSLQVAGNWGGHAFLWQSGVMTDLGTLPGDDFSRAAAINEAGQVLGTSPGTVYGAPNSHAFLWQGGTMTDITPAGDNFSTAAAFNSSGQVAGMSGLREDHVVWIPGHWEKRGFGRVWVPGHYVNHWVLLRQRNLLWGHGTTTDLGSLVAAAINASGWVVGSAPTASGDAHAVLWEKGAMIDLGTLPDTSSSSAAAINASGQVVGASGSFAFLWQKGAMSNLNSLIPADSGWVLTQANVINDAGQIVGAGTVIVDGETLTHAFLLTPVK